MRSGLDRTTIIRNLSVLIKKGLCEEVIVEGVRGTCIRLTALGVKSFDEAIGTWKQAQSTILKVVGADEMDSFLRVLTKLEEM